MSDTVEVRDIEVDADDLAAALDELPDDDYIVDEHALVGDVLVRGDGDRDTYVIVTDLVSGESSGIITIESVQARLDEVIEDDAGLYIRAEDEMGDWGFKIPLDEPDAFTIEKRDTTGGSNPYAYAWDSSVDVGEMISGSGSSAADHLQYEADRFDSYAVLSKPEIVEE